MDQRLKYENYNQTIIKALQENLGVNLFDCTNDYLLMIKKYE